MKESVTKFDLEAAFKALDEIDVPVSEKGIKANRPALNEIFSRKSKFEALFEEYYDINSQAELGEAKEAREAEIAQAKLERIEKIVDLDAKSAEDLLTTYVGKYIIQCPQCMTLFYKDKEDVVESEDDPNTVNVNEVCQHCGNESGYSLVGKVDAAEAEEPAEEIPMEDELNLDIPEESAEEPTEETSEEAVDDMSELDALDLDLEEPIEEEKTEESFVAHTGETLVEDIKEDKELEDRLNDHNEYIEYLRAAILDEEAALEKATNEQVKAAIQRRIEAFKVDLENALPEEVKNDLMAADTQDDVVEEHPAEDTEATEESITESLTESANNPLKEENDLEVSADEFEELIKSPEFQKPISDTTVRAMMSAEKEADNKEEVKESKSTYKCSNCRYEVEMDDEEYDGSCPNCHEHKGEFYKLEEGIFDKLKLTRAGKADWVLANARKDYSKIKIDRGNLVPDEDNRLFKTFVVIAFKNKDINGKTITAAPSFDKQANLVPAGKTKTTQDYKTADAIAKNWSASASGGPAFIFLAREKTDGKALFLCEYFQGKLEYDNVEKYYEAVKKDIKRNAKINKKGGWDDEEEEPAETTAEEPVEKEKTVETEKQAAIETTATNETEQEATQDTNNQQAKTPTGDDDKGAGSSEKNTKDENKKYHGHEVSNKTISAFRKLMRNMNLEVYDAFDKKVGMDIPSLGKINAETLLDYTVVINGKKVGVADWLKGLVKNGIIAENFVIELCGKELYESISRSSKLCSIMEKLEEIKENSLEELISSSLVEAYGNVAGFKLAECAYLNNKFTVNGTIYFTSGNTRKTTYAFSESYTTEDGKINLRGLNEKLGADKKFTLTGRVENKTLITESFKCNK